MEFSSAYDPAEREITVCTMEYAPVCGQPVFDCPEGAACMEPLPVTYSNKCMMHADGAKFLYTGTCEDWEPIPVACPENWDPVCGKTQPKACMGPGCASEYKTYSNTCFMKQDKAEFQYEGECKDDEPKPIACTREYDPVCGQPVFDCPEGAVCMMPLPVTYSNKCMMQAAGAEYLYHGKCEQDTPVLPEPTDTKYYVGDTNSCQLIDYTCEEGWEVI